MKDTQEYRKITFVLNRLKLVGNKMPLEAKTLDGDSVKLTNLRGKVVLVNFWSSASDRCMEEIDNIKEQYKKYHDKGFEVRGHQRRCDGARAACRAGQERGYPVDDLPRRRRSPLHGQPVRRHDRGRGQAGADPGGSQRQGCVDPRRGDNLAPLIEKALAAATEDSADDAKPGAKKGKGKDKKKDEALAAKKKAAALART